MGANWAGHNMAAPSYDADAQTYFDAMTGPATESVKGIVDALVRGLKDDGNWTFLDWLSLSAAHDSQAGLINLKNPTQVATLVNAPTFTTDRGFTGDGATSYIDFGWNPTTASSPNFVQNDASMGVWIGTDATSGTQYDMGTSTRHSINSHVGSNQARFYPNQTSAATVAIPANTGVGLSAWTRRGASATETYKNGTSLGDGATASGALFAGNFFGLATNNVASVGNPVFFSTRRMQAAFWGAQRSDAQMLTIYNRLLAYMTEKEAV